MPYTETISIPQNSRGFFLRERDAINSEYGISLKFPRGRGNMHGDYQDMIVSASGHSKVRAAMPKIRSILEHANEQYREFCIRRDARKGRARNYVSKAQPPSSSKTISNAVQKPINSFAALDGLFEQEQEQRKIDDAILADQKRMDDAIANGTVPKPCSSKTAPMNFAAALSKPKKVSFANSVVAPKVRINVVVPKSNSNKFVASRSPSPEPKYHFPGEDYSDPVEWFDWSEEA